MDWVVLSEIARNIALTVSAPFGAFVAWKGLNSWKAEKGWESDHTLARQLAIALRRRSDAFRQLRNALMSGAEMSAAIAANPDPKASPQDIDTDAAWILAMNARLARFQETRLQYYGYQIEAETVWEEPIKARSDELVDIEFDVILAIEDIAEKKIRKSSVPLNKEEKEEDVRTRKLALGRTGDDVDKRYGSQTDAIQSILKSKLKAKR